ncbi:wax ester synthase-like acyl-CoA acyltransferase domain-containing protein [Fomitopsis serialis]|uniref:wax ester synthase-like acyl-CoA acyltransferase domain-containing protein n=1 Tax=Fomitopsis serialis TaxID=139415 RepID=UPI0020078E18|nr:wax ester synthase-like acyl-CoA acyltransferase domain-containing protein [Neoantrodia serialis]KAH9925720.1 wax ester synthase-like acyl-CoA acyltransferase domain-containing protein [Neoantrodia serialis]
MVEDRCLRIPGSFGVGTNGRALNVEHKAQWSLLGLRRDSDGFTGRVMKTILLGVNWFCRDFQERRQSIGGMDNLWFLLADVTDFNPVCTSAYTLKGRLTLEDLYSAAQRQSEKFPKYKQRVTSVLRRFHGARFEEDPDFNLKNHIHAVSLPEPAGKHELNDLMGKVIAQEWDLKHPLWEAILVENYRDETDAESALIMRGHHALADGQGFGFSQLHITSYHDELVHKMDSAADYLHAVKRGKVLPSKLHRSLRPLDLLATNTWTAPLLELIMACAFWFVYAVSTFVGLFWSVYQAAHQIALSPFRACSGWRVGMLTVPQPGPRVTEREFASSRVFSIKDVKLCQQAFSGAKPGSAVAGVPKEQREKARTKTGHVTLNDVVCAVMADVLGKEIASRPANQLNGLWEQKKRRLRTVPPSPRIGFFIPMSIRTPGDWSMRNLSTGSKVDLNPSPNLSKDVTIRELHAHIHQCRRELSILKRSLLPRMCFNILQLTGQFPALLNLSLLAEPIPKLKELCNKWLMKPIYDTLLQSFPVVLTKGAANNADAFSVPGPANSTITLQGKEVLKWTVLPPQGGKGTIGMGIISYAGGISIAVAADKVPSSLGVAERICTGFEERFELYVKRAREVLDHVD